MDEPGMMNQTMSPMGGMIQPMITIINNPTE